MEVIGFSAQNLRRALLAAVAGALICVAGAPAATVSLRVERACGDSCEQLAEDVALSRLRFVAAPGERNDVVFTREGDAVVVRDRGVPVEAGEGCEPVDPQRVRCVLPVQVYELRVALSDMDDRVTLRRPLGRSRDGWFDTVAGCGSGADLVRAAGLLDADCERLAVAGRVLRAQPVRVLERRIAFASPCRCRGSVTLTVEGHTVGRARVRPGRRVAVTLRRPLPQGGATVVAASWKLGRRRGGYRFFASP